MIDTSMLRVNKELKEELKARAQADGRTLEWSANDAIAQYVRGAVISIEGTPRVVETAVEPPIVPLKELGLEMGCCALPTPCKHWVFNPLDATWKNTLSGRIRET